MLIIKYLSLESGKKLTSDDFSDALVAPLPIRCVPAHLRNVNAPELIASRVRSSSIRSTKEHATSNQEAIADRPHRAFQRKVTQECFYGEELRTVHGTRVVTDLWRQFSNHRRAHKTLNGLTSWSFASCSAASPAKSKSDNRHHTHLTFNLG